MTIKKVTTEGWITKQQFAKELGVSNFDQWQMMGNGSKRPFKKAKPNKEVCKVDGKILYSPEYVQTIKNLLETLLNKKTDKAEALIEKHIFKFFMNFMEKATSEKEAHKIINEMRRVCEDHNRS